MRAPRHERLIKGPVSSKAKPRGGIVHCTVSNPLQGPGDRHGVIGYLANKGISVPVVNDDEASTIMRPLGELGYGHAACLSGEAWGIEQIGQATWSRKEWLRHKGTLKKTAEWAAWLLTKMELPVTDRNLRRFIAGHADDHKLGGCSDHWDPGPGYPFDLVYKWAVEYAQQKGYRVTAEKGDRQKIRDFRAPLSKRARLWMRKRARRGWNVVTRKKIYRSDFDAWDDGHV